VDQATHNKIVSFIWGIADDVLRDLFKRGKYPDVILPMCVIRRMDAVLEPTKRAVLDTKRMLDEARITEQRAALCEAAGQAFYNTSKFTLRDLKSRGSQQQLLADFEDYLNGFSPNVQDILDNFKFRNQLTTLSKADAIGTLINKFLDPDIDLSPAGIDNHSMGTVFEELVRKFNEDNNEEAGEHWTPRDAVRLMANLVFLPIEAKIKSGTYLLYDCACGTGGMLTVGEETLTAIGAKRSQQIKCLLYGQEINPETYAVCKADMLLKGEGESADHIVGGAEWSTLSHDAFPAQEFDFMLANPPYGKSWKKDLEAMPECEVLTAHHEYLQRLFTTARGTSYAAPLVAYKAAMVLRAFPGASANLLRALLVNSASVPTQSEDRLKDVHEDAVRHVCGYGIPDATRATTSDVNRVVLYQRRDRQPEGTEAVVVAASRRRRP
jgi:type I restriction enzyme M protein